MTMLFSLLSPARWAAVIVALAASLLFYQAWAGHQRKLGAAPYIAAIERQKAEASKALAVEVEKTRAANQALLYFKNIQEKIDAKNQIKIEGLSTRLRAAAGPAGRLRDPNAARCGSGGSGATATDSTSAIDSASDGADAGGLLSAELTGLLLEQARIADQINAAYTSCRADSITLRGLLQ